MEAQVQSQVCPCEICGGQQVIFSILHYPHLNTSAPYSFIHHVRHHNGCSTKGLSLIPPHDFREKIQPLSCQDGYLNIGTWFMKNMSII